MEWPPQKLSIDDLNSPDDWEIAARLQISLDGQVLDSVVAYDCAAGTVARFKKDGDGNFVLNAHRSEVVREVLHGAVSVAWKTQ